MEINHAIFRFFNAWAGQTIWLDTLLIFFADYLDIILVLTTLFIIFFLYDPKPKIDYFSWLEIKQRIKGLGVVALSTGIAWITALILKAIFQTPRPYLALENVTLLFTYGGHDSFPSGHATVFSALAVALFIYNKKIGIAFGFFAILIGLSRIIVGIHFPFDILVGYLLGGIIAWTTYRSYKIVRKKVTI